VLVRAGRDGKWCLFDLLSRRLRVHLVAHFRNRLGWRTEAPEAKQIALDTFWATRSLVYPQKAGAHSASGPGRRREV
jgi:hypothetical protein